MIFEELPIVKCEDDFCYESVHSVVEEFPLSVIVNGRHALTAMISPVLLQEFVTGFLYTERIIKELDDIESVRIEDNSAGVLTKNPFAILTSHKTVLSGCGGSTSFLDAGRLPKINSDLKLSVNKIRDFVKLTLDSKLHKKTGGIHIIGLFNEIGEPLLIAEDIGRHNALDKVIGFGLMNGIDLTRTYVVSSGRISSEMVRKCLVAGIPVVLSRGATTTAAIEAANAGGLTIVGFVRSRKMNVYSGFERISEIE